MAYLYNIKLCLPGAYYVLAVHRYIFQVHTIIDKICSNKTGIYVTIPLFSLISDVLQEGKVYSQRLMLFAYHVHRYRSDIARGQLWLNVQCSFYIQLEGMF